MENKSWTRVPSILQTVTATFSDLTKKSSVEQFRDEIEGKNQLGSLATTFDNIIGNKIS